MPYAPGALPLWAVTNPSLAPLAARLRLSAMALALGITGAAAQTPDTSCYVTGGGALEICRGNEAEGVFAAPPACAAGVPDVGYWFGYGHLYK